MTLTTLLNPELTFCNIQSRGKSQLLHDCATLIASKVDGLTADEIFAALMAREQLGSTGLGDGIAIPHCRIPRYERSIGCLVKLKDGGTDFDAIDGKPVDILCFLLVPENSLEGHLEILRTLAEHFTDPAFCARLRAAQSDAALYHAAVGTP
ncbi:MAG: PTS sugar transporter subunit IIA [Pseudomonadales bacterium]|jgi:PTS system nitrogen regulatory IIA component|nr:PTS sugar transporter subunit IIA [Pseudomonadales bacterium]